MTSKDVMRSGLKELGINLGYKCNFKCAHCSVTEPASLNLSQEEIRLLGKVIKKYRPPSILLVGGEPVLYTEIANDILQRAGSLSGISVRMITNGFYASSKAAAIKTLSRFYKLNSLLLSYDKFHAKFLPFGNIRNLFLACKDLGIRFGVACAIESPLELLLIEKIKRAGKFKVYVQRVLPIGRAKRNDIGYPYQSFDAGVLAKSCPNAGKIMYFCGRGFSVCCSNLLFNSASKFMIHRSVSAHRNSRFYRKIVNSDFKAFADELGLTTKEFLPEHSIQCNLCEHLFQVAKQSGQVWA